MATCRDDIVFDFQCAALKQSILQFVDKYNAEVDRCTSAPILPKERTPQKVDEFVDYSHVKWSETLKSNLRRGKKAQYIQPNVRNAMHRPFCKQYLHFDPVFIERTYQQHV